MWSRFFAVFRKEILQLKRDRRTIAMIVIQPAMMMIVFGIAFGGEITHLPIAVANLDSDSTLSWYAIQKFEESDVTDVVEYVNGFEDARSLVEKGSVTGSIVIPSTFSETIQESKTANIIVITDGSQPQIASVIIAEAQKISVELSEEFSKKYAVETSISVATQSVKISTFSIRLYGSVKNIDAFAPGVMGLVVQQITTIFTAISLVKEKERGSIEMIIVSPIHKAEFIIGKLVPYIIVALAIICNVLMVGIGLFGLVVRGSIVDVFLISILFAIVCLGLGMLVSTISKNQLQAVQATVIFFLPSILFSGFFFPVEAFPRTISWIPFIIPLYYYINGCRSIMTKGKGIGFIYADLLALSLIAFLTISFSIQRFVKKLE
ncbi:MAG: ABC transporter permease [Promethearchaeota archaeon]